MNQKKRMLTVLLAGAMALGALSACSPAEPAASGQESAASQAAASEAGEEVKPEDIKATVDVWTWEPYENQKAIIADFNKVYPNIAIEFTTVETKDMPMKFQTALASDSDVPDVAWCPIDNRGKMMALDCWEDLSEAPYNISRQEMLDYQIPVSETPSGKLAGIEVSTPVAGLAYKRGLAKEYFGTDDPEALSTLLPTWDAMIEKGKTIVEKSGGKVKLFTSNTGPFAILKGQNQEPMVLEQKLNLKAALGNAFDKVIAMKEAGVVDNIESWTPAWDAAITEDSHIFFNCATWVPTWVLKAKDPDGAGDWGMMLPPDGGFMDGGTVVCIPQKAQDKDAAFQYIKWNYFTKEGAVSNRDNLDYMSAYKPVYDDESFYSREDAFFGGQDILKTFAQTIIPNTKVPRAVSVNDIEVDQAISIALKTISDSKAPITTDQILADMTKEILANVPELTAE